MIVCRWRTPPGPLTQQAEPASLCANPNCRAGQVPKSDMPDLGTRLPMCAFIYIRTGGCPGSWTRADRGVLYFFSLSARLDGDTFTSSLRTAPLTGCVSVRDSLRSLTSSFTTGRFVTSTSSSFWTSSSSSRMGMRACSSSRPREPVASFALAQAFPSFLHAFARLFHLACGSFAHVPGPAGQIGFAGFPGFLTHLFLEIPASLPDDHSVLLHILNVVVGDREILVKEPAALDQEGILVNSLDYTQFLALCGICCHAHPHIRMSLHEFFFGQHGHTPSCFPVCFIFPADSRLLQLQRDHHLTSSTHGTPLSADGKERRSPKRRGLFPKERPAVVTY